MTMTRMGAEMAATVTPVALAAAREAQAAVLSLVPQVTLLTCPRWSTQEIRCTTHGEGADQGHGLRCKITIDHDNCHRHQPRDWWTTDAHLKGAELELVKASTSSLSSLEDMD